MYINRIITSAEPPSTFIYYFKIFRAKTEHIMELFGDLRISFDVLFALKKNYTQFKKNLFFINFFRFNDRNPRYIKFSKYYCFD